MGSNSKRVIRNMQNIPSSPYIKHNYLSGAKINYAVYIYDFSPNSFNIVRSCMSVTSFYFSDTPVDINNDSQSICLINVLNTTLTVLYLSLLLCSTTLRFFNSNFIILLLYILVRCLTRLIHVLLTAPFLLSI